MPELHDPIQSESKLWGKIQEITKGVYKGSLNTPEEKAIAWRISEGEKEEVLEEIKKSTTSTKDKFDLAVMFFSEAKETEDELEFENIKLSPVREETKEYMMDCLITGILELKDNDNPNELTERLDKILSIISRASEGTCFGNDLSDKECFSATYLSKNHIKDLCNQINIIALFLKNMNYDQKTKLMAINRISERIVL